MIKESLELRKRIKSKKPTFLRQDAHKRPRLENKWRRPKGLQSKMRLNKRGYRRSISPGFGSPINVKYFHGCGLKIIKINSLKDLSNVKDSFEGALLNKTLGLKSKIAIAKKAVELKIRVINIRNLDKFIKDSENKINQRKESKKKKNDSKSKKKVVTKKEEKLENLTEEDKKEKAKKEKDKILTKKDN